MPKHYYVKSKQDYENLAKSADFHKAALYYIEDTAEIYAHGIRFGVGTAISSDHSSTETTYGIGTSSKYGHVKLGSGTPKGAGTASAGSTSAGVAAAWDHVHPLQTSVSGSSATTSKVTKSITVSNFDAYVPTNTNIPVGALVTFTGSGTGAPYTHSSVGSGIFFSPHANYFRAIVFPAAVSTQYSPLAIKEYGASAAVTTWRYVASGNQEGSALKVEHALTLQIGGTTKATYDGSTTKTFDVTLSNLGAAAAEHTHTLSSLTDLNTDWSTLLAAAPTDHITRWPKWSEVTGKPTTFTPTAHSHGELKGWTSATTTATTPNTYASIVKVQGIKTTATLGISDMGTNATVIGWRGGTNSNGYAWELASTDKHRLYVRSGSTTTWNNSWSALAYLTDITWDNVASKPTKFTPADHDHTFASLTSKPTTLLGYGITDAKIANGVITLGSNTITPLTTLPEHNHGWNKITTTAATNIDNFKSVAFQVTYGGGGNTATTKPTGVDAFGLISFQSAGGYYTQLMRSSNASKGWYYRDYTGSAWSAWKVLLDSENSSINKSTGETKINGVSATFSLSTHKHDNDYAPKTHSHALADITDINSSWATTLKSAPAAYVTRWPSWSEITGVPSSFVPSAHTHNVLTWTSDTRSTGTTPSDYKKSFTFVGIKTPSAIGLTTTIAGSYVSLFGWKGYSDNSGPHSWELASDNKERIHVRSGVGVQSNGSGNEDWTAWKTLAYTSDLAWGTITGKPTSFTPASHNQAWSTITSTPTTLAGYGITDAKIADGVITLGSNTITPITSHQSLADYIKKDGTVAFTGTVTTKDIKIDKDPGYIEFWRGNNSSWKLLNSADFIIQNNYTSSRGNYFDVFTLKYNSGDAVLKGTLNAKGGLQVNGTAVSLSGHTHSYLPLSGGKLTGALTMNDVYLIKPDAQSVSTTSSVTGAITIALPASVGNTMVSMWIDVYNYVTNTAFSVHVGGYTYNNSTWANNPFAIVYGADHKVRLGHNGTSFVIYIGELTSKWAYPQVAVRDVLLGYGGTVANWKKSWTISFTSNAFSNVTATCTDKAWTSRNFTPSNYSASTHNHDTVYLKQAGGTISSDSYGPLTIKRTGSTNMAAIKFENASGVLGSIGMNTVNGNLIIYNAATTASRTILDSDNSTINASTGAVKINGTTATFSLSTHNHDDKYITESTGLFEKTLSLDVGTDWMDTGIDGNYSFGTAGKLASGTYIVQVYANIGGKGGLYQEYHSGVMSWFSGTCNDANSDEIILHKAGHATNGKGLYLRTLRQKSSGVLKLQIASAQAFGATANLQFKFKKII